MIENQISMDEKALRKQIEEQLLKYNKLKKPFETRRRLSHSYGWYGDEGPRIVIEIWFYAIIGSFLLFLLPLPEVVAYAVMGVVLLLTPLLGVIGYIVEAIWKASEPRKNRRIVINNRKLYKQLLGIDYNYPNYDNIDYIIAVINKEITQEYQEIPKNPREAYKNPYAYPRYGSKQNQYQKTEENTSAKSEPSYNNTRTNERYTKSKTSQSTYITCPMCGGKLIIRNGPYGRFYGCRNYPKCRYTRSL